MLESRGDSEGIELVHLAQFGGELRRRDAVADAQARGMQRLAEGEHRETASAQRWLCERAVMARTGEHDVLVDLIRNDEQVAFVGET